MGGGGGGERGKTLITKWQSGLKRTKIVILSEIPNVMQMSFLGIEQQYCQKHCSYGLLKFNEQGGKIVLTRIISIVRIPSLFSNKDNREKE